MTHEDQHATPGAAHTAWRVGSIVLAVTLLAVACTGNGDGTRGPRAQPSPPSVSSAASPPRAVPSPPPAAGVRGLIAYSTPAGDIWVMDADGSNRRQVTRTRDPAFDFDPSLSPDGRRVVFRTSRGRYTPDPNGTGVQGIFVVDLDGSHERQIQPPRGGLFPDWSPDGRRIAFSTLRANGTETMRGRAACPGRLRDLAGLGERMPALHGVAGSDRLLGLR
jgi:dipeptidyl aminopeptidase/acylaminoacyl peptidase